LGALTLVRADAARLYTVADLALAEELARRAALAIDNARLHQAEQQARQAAEASNARLEAQIAQRSRQLREAKAVLEREVADRQRTEAKLRSSREQLRNLSARLQMVREAERSRVAREILDGFGQTMSALKMEVAWLRQNLGSGEAERLKQRATGALGMIDGAIRTVRQMAADLHPRILDDLGLAAALEWQTQRFERRTGIRCRFMPGVAEIRIDPDAATAVFRIYEEILSNVTRHALASRVVVTLQPAEGQLILAVRDNGRSITAEEIASPHSLGLIGMRELARSHNGVLEITGQQGKGTTVTLNMPLGGNAR
jgi:signal transduction histidine kinase